VVAASPATGSQDDSVAPLQELFSDTPSESLFRAIQAARAKQPSWGTVFANTLRLWGQRRVRPMWPNRAGRRVTAILAVVLLLLVAAGITLLVSRTGTASRPGTSSGGGVQTAGASGPHSLGTVAGVRRAAATWVAKYVSGDAIVACDPAMCMALQAQHIPSGRLLAVQPAQSGPLGSTIVLATASVRSQYGASLANVYAPVVLASFGSGAAQIAVRVVAPDGGAAYRANLVSDIQQRRVFGLSLSKNPDVHLTPAARAALLAGQVDARLLINLATLATLHQVDVMSFGGLPGHGASAGVPLRAAEIAPVKAAGSAQESPQAMRSFLLAQQPLFHPSAVSLVRTSSGQTALRIEFGAPTPLGLLGSRHT
jgi:hypothetical protein